MKKLISWNVNGIRACVRKGFPDYFKKLDAHIFCIQESRVQEGQIDLELEGISILELCKKKAIPVLLFLLSKSLFQYYMGWDRRT